MRRPRSAHLLGLALLLLGAGPLRAEDEGAPRLRYNPFGLPELESLARGLEALERDEDDGDGEPVFQPVVRATLVAGDRSLANLSGVVLSPGEESHGYQLLEVRQFEAVFLHDGERVVLPVDGTEEAEE